MLLSFIWHIDNRIQITILHVYKEQENIMKKNLLSAMLVSTAALTIGATVNAAPCKGPCAVPPPKTEAKQCQSAEIQKPQVKPEECKKPEDKKAEFNKRMNLSDAQKAQLEKIKADEKKLLEPIHKKMEKKNEELRGLMKKESDIRTQSMENFNALLTPEQTEELNKIKAELHQKMKKDFESKGPRHMMKPKCVEGCKGPQMKEPDCKCPCHKKPMVK